MSQWFAIFNGATGDLVSSGDVVTFPLNTGLRAVTIDGPPGSRSWDRVKLDFVTTQPPPPPPPAAPFPYLEEWGTVNLVFTGQQAVATMVSFTEPFTVPPLIDSLVVNVPGKSSGSAYLEFTTGLITSTGFQLNGKAPAAINFTIPVVWHAVQRYKEKA